MMRRLRGIFEPSLMRRLMLAQLGLLALLWGLLLGFVVYESSTDDHDLRQDALYDAVLIVADQLADRPAQLREAFRYIELALSENIEKSLAPRLVLERGELTLYRSAGVPASLRTQRPDDIETVTFDGKRWRARARISPGGMRMTMIVPADRMNIFVTLNSKGFYLLPLLISIPFLALPAWLSIRVALRPWNAVAREVGSRGPRDLAPLSFRPRHRELRAMVDNIDALMRRLHDASTRERAFIADAAHELRTPLAAMRVNVEALQGQAVEPRQRELLAGIVSGVTRAGRLVGQMLNLMRSDAAGTGHTEKVALDALLQDRMAALSCLADARYVELDLEAEPGLAVDGCRETLTSLIDNLVDNAIKYSPQGGTVEVRLRRDGECAMLTVCDEGPGIPLALRERVFDRFYRDPAQTQSGSGLGLAIAQAAVVRHEGRIVLEGRDAGSGLRARVRLPLAGSTMVPSAALAPSS
ncbi:sensor histidine kinase [Pseudoduganella albidiflava]|uniref:histidine kinase n=1 Tax=Pseudoduganella albidiflava TaxID=321983 RepID=A0A411WWQ9_9BURK|nr:ATP-binding protein [Pseudoduganella albidiflava]QBI01146.1 sensor histidine kinase [Pseudoduganella albidiflava]GGY48485.1 two-component sensor histidine kinase [Pseudoduganella albidiflava]